MFYRLCDSLIKHPKIIRCSILASYVNSLCSVPPPRLNELELIKHLQEIKRALPYLTPNKCNNFTGSARDLIYKLLSEAKYRASKEKPLLRQIFEDRFRSGNEG